MIFITYTDRTSNCQKESKTRYYKEKNMLPLLKVGHYLCLEDQNRNINFEYKVCKTKLKHSIASLLEPVHIPSHLLCVLWKYGATTTDIS